MGFFKTRLGIIAAVLLGGVALATADEVLPFAQVEVHGPKGRTFHAQAAVEGLIPTPTSIVLAGDGFLMTLTVPKEATAGTQIPVPATLQSADLIQRSTLTLSLQETSPFLSGTLSGQFGVLKINGSLRVRMATPPPAAVAAAP